MGQGRNLRGNQVCVCVGVGVGVGVCVCVWCGGGRQAPGQLGWECTARSGEGRTLMLEICGTIQGCKIS